MWVAVENDSTGEKKGRYPQDLEDKAQGETFFGGDDGRQDWSEEEDSNGEKSDDAEYVTLEKIPPDSSEQKGSRPGYVGHVDEIFFSSAVPDGVVIPGDHGKSEKKEAYYTENNGHDKGCDQRQRPGDKYLPTYLQTRRR